MNTYKIFQVIVENVIRMKLIPEYKFLGNRKFRFDYAIPEIKLAIEINGGVWINGRHTRTSGYLKDLEKFNLATCNGWHLLQFVPEQLNT
jgi:very-short-patch-repair endonuclease